IPARRRRDARAPVRPDPAVAASSFRRAACDGALEHRADVPQLLLAGRHVENEGAITRIEIARHFVRDLSLSRGKLRSGRGRSGALFRCGLSHLHSRRACQRGGAAAHRRGVRARRRTLPCGMTMLLQQGLAAQARARPDAVALVFKNVRVTYGALEEASDRLARVLADSGCRRGDRVALLMPKMPAAIIAMFGVLKADAIYVPLDPAGPGVRLARMLEASDCRCILAAGPVGRMLREALAAAKLEQRPLIGWLDEELPAEADPAPTFTVRDLDAYPATAPACANGDGDIAHILFTSGSTGAPKGVMITHRSAAHFIRWATAYFGTAPMDRISQHPPLHFDLSTFDIFGTLSAGAELHLVPRS